MKNLIDFFYIGKNGSFIEEITDELIFIDTDKNAHSDRNMGNLHIINGHFIPFQMELIVNSKFTKDSTLTQICDGIALEMQSKTLLVIEIKTNLGYKTYQKVLQQLTASYIKALQNISLISKIEDIDIQFFITGNWMEEFDEENTFNAKEGELTEKEIIYQSYRRLRKVGNFTFKKIPCFSFLADKLHESYKKQNVKIFYYKPDSTHIFQTP